MYNLKDFCCICLCNTENLQQISTTDSDNITYICKLIISIPEMNFNEMNVKRLLCNECCDSVNATYKFRQKCLRSKIMLIDYIAKLRSISTVSGQINVHLTDYRLKIDKERSELVNENEEATLNTSFEIKTEPIEHRVSEFDQIDETFVKIEDNNEHGSYINENNDNSLGNSNKNETECDFQRENEKSDVLNEIKTESTAANASDVVSPLIEEIIIKTENNIEDTAEHIVEKNDGDYLDDSDITSNEPENYTETSEDKNGIYQCKVCKKNFAHTYGLTYHMRIHEGKRRFECKICKKRFLQSGHRYQHMQIHAKKREYECNICNKKFLFSKYLQEHLRRHAGTKEFECTICNKKLASSTSLRVHKRIHTGERPYGCDICQAKFNNLTTLTNHMTIHSKQLYKCEICNKEINSLSSFAQHKRMHSVARPYECTVCKRTFETSHQLDKHMRNHTIERPHQCSICNEKFARTSTLKIHLTTHTGESPHQCNICKKNFTRSASLKNHLRLHTGERPYECEICKKRFSESRKLRAHMRTHAQS